MPPKRKSKPRVRVRRQPRPNQRDRNKHKLIQKVNVNVNSSGGSGGGGSSQIPYPFLDRSGENVALQRLSDSVNNFMKQAQNIKSLEPLLIAPTTYNDSPVDDVKAQRDVRLSNSILNPRPDNSSTPLTHQIPSLITDNQTQTENVSLTETESQTNPDELAIKDKSKKKIVIVDEAEEDDPSVAVTQRKYTDLTPEERKQEKLLYISNKSESYHTLLTNAYQENLISQEYLREGMSRTFRNKIDIDNALRDLKLRVTETVRSKMAFRKPKKLDP